MNSILVDVKGHVGYLILTQPRTLNALTSEMVNALKVGLHQHEANSDVALIVIKSDNERAFCAGGEMKQLRNYALQQDTAAIASFFRDEYSLNLAIAECSKPYLAIIDGVAMGGGLGISVHGRYRIVTEHAVLAMPESRIGFFPDVGGSYFLPRLPYRCGYWLGLTAASVKGHQAISTGLATHAIKRSAIPELLKALESLPVSSALSENSTQQSARSPVPPDNRADNRADNQIDQCIMDCLDNTASVEHDVTFLSCLKDRQQWFADASLYSIESRLEQAAVDNQDAAHLLELLQGASPYSSAITLSLLERTADLPLQQCLEAEHALAIEACTHPDFVEGIRAVLVDKDRQPNWQT